MRWRQLAIYLGVSCALAILAGIIFGFVYAWRAHDRLENELARLKATHQSLNFTDFEEQPVAAEDNAATYLFQAKDGLEALREVFEPWDEAKYDALARGELSPGVEEAVDACLSQHPDVVELVVRSTKCPKAEFGYDFSGGFEPFSESSEQPIRLLRAANQLMQIRTLEVLKHGHGDDALRNSIAMLRLSAHADTNPTIVGELVAIACRDSAVRAADAALRDKPDPTLCAELEAELARIDHVALWRNAISGERAMLSKDIHDFYFKLAKPGPAGAIWSVAYSKDFCAFLERFDVILPLLGKPFNSILTDIKDLDDRRDGGLMTALLTSNFDAVMTTMCRDIAMTRCVRIHNAIVSQGLVDSTDKDVLSRLDLPVDVKTDPFDGQSLRVRKLSGGWLIYSIGPDLKDEGGRLNFYRDVGLGPPETWAPAIDEPEFVEPDADE